MALLKCEECGNMVSSKAKVCQKCGAAPTVPKEEIHPVLAVLVILSAIGFVYMWCAPNTSNTGAATLTTVNSNQSNSAPSNAAPIVNAVIIDKQSLPNKIANQAIKSVEKKSSWKKVEILAAGNDVYSLGITYKETPKNYDEIEYDTKTIGRSLLKALATYGIDPSKHYMAIAVAASVPEDVETGSVRFLGSTVYNFDFHKLLFHPGNSIIQQHP